MKQENLRNFSVIFFLILTVSLMSKLHTKEIAYENVVKEKEKIVLQHDLEKTKLHKGFLLEEKELLEKLDEQKKMIRELEADLKELEEFKEVLKTVRKFGINNLNEREQELTALSLYKTSKKIRLDWKLMASLIMVESSYRPKIISNDPSYGLMQIKLGTANYIERKMSRLNNKKIINITAEDLLQIEKNIEIGGRYLLGQIVKFQNVNHGIMAYNFGGKKFKELKKELGHEMESIYLKKIKKYYEKI